MSSERTWLTTAEAARELGLAHSTIRQAIMRGRLQAEKVGPRLNVVMREELERYRREHLGKQGWDKRHAPEFEPSPMAAWARKYRAAVIP